jgi:hypothetical protein
MAGNKAGITLIKENLVRNEDAFFQSGRADDLWQRYCGFLSLSLDEFIHIQHGLLKEQIGFLNNIADQKEPPTRNGISTIDEFRQSLPLKNYENYSSQLQEEHENLLPEKPFYWVHTSAARGTYKKVPWTSRFNSVQCRNVISALILSAAQDMGDIKLAPGCRVLHLLPGRPFASASLAHALLEQFSVRTIPPLGEDENMAFTARIDKAMTMGLSSNIDYVVAMTSSLIKMGERFDHVWNKTRKNPLNILKIHPQVDWRLLNRKNNNEHFPVDVWALKGIVSWGADSAGLSGAIEQQWGRRPVQMYGSSEGGIMAMQDWHKKAMALLPDVVFFEFIPEEKVHIKDPPTVLIDELQEGKVYELVISNYYGMPMARYRQGDLVRIVKDGSNSGGVPRITWFGRADDTIDVFGISRINTGVLSEALTKLGLTTANWFLHKEYDDGHVILRLYVESDHKVQSPSLEHSLSRALKSIDRHWGEAVYTMAYNPIRIKLVPVGTFQHLGFPDRDDHSVKVNPPESCITELGRFIGDKT